MTIHIETVSIPNGTPNLSGYLALPDGNDKLSAVVVIHEAFGLNENIKSITRRFAEAGYAALAVDLIAGRNPAVCMFRFFAGVFLNSLQHGAIRDLKVALDWFERHPRVDSGRLGAVGFCLGGNFSICWACTDSRLNVIAPFYSMNPRPIEAVARACPVVGSYPEQDFSRSHGVRLDAELAKHNIPRDIKIYPNTHHSFFNRERTDAEKQAAEDAWVRIMAFFEKHIGT